MSAAIVERLREKVEEALPRLEAAGALFAALARWGSRIPTDDTELTAFVHGPLQDELGLRMQLVPLKRLMAGLEDVLATAGAMTADHEIPIDVDVPPKWRDEVSTKAMRSIAGPVPVLVIATTSALAIRLRAVLGDDAIDVESRGDARSVVRALATSPMLAIVDAFDAPPIPMDALADAVVHATRTRTLVWGSDLVYGRALIDAADVRGVSLSGIATAEGVAAILDVVISRRA